MYGVRIRVGGRITDIPLSLHFSLVSRFSAFQDAGTVFKILVLVLTVI